MFILLPLPWIIRYFLPPSEHHAQVALKIPFFNALKSILETNTTLRSKYFLSWFTWMLWLLLITAVARPEWLGDVISLPRTGRDIMVAVDISGSMQTPDMTIGNMQVTRLDAIKAVAHQFIKQRVGDRIGLILFGSRAYLQTPLTFDRDTVLALLDDATIALAGPHTAIGDAIGLAIKHLRDRPQNSRVLILLTDGANNSGLLAPLEAARLANENDVKIYTIGIGTDSSEVPRPFGSVNTPVSDLDTETLQKIAKMTGGIFFKAQDTDSLIQIYQKLDQLEPVASDHAIVRPVIPLYPWPLAAAFLLSLLFAIHQSSLFARRAPS
jgi:Ca-activated chloride channel family protein